MEIALAAAGLTAFFTEMLAPLVLCSSIPLGIPPAPPDPALARVAPQKCVLYVSWAGAAAPDPKSTNRAERFLADPEIQHLRTEAFRRFQGLIGSLVKTGTFSSTEFQQQTKESPFWIHLLATRPAACFIGSFSGDPQSPKIDAAMVVNVGPARGEVAAKLAQYQKRDEGTVEVAQVGPRTEYRSKGDGTSPPHCVATQGDYLILTAGKETPADIVKRMAGPEPAWLTAIAKDLPVQRRAVVMRLDCQALWDALSTSDADSAQAINTAGFDRLRSLTLVTGLDREDFVSRVLVELDPRVALPLHLAANRPLKAGDLAAIPRDATLAFAARVEPMYLLAALRWLEKNAADFGLTGSSGDEDPPATTPANAASASSAAAAGDGKTPATKTTAATADGTTRPRPTQAGEDMKVAYDFNIMGAEPEPAVPHSGSLLDDEFCNEAAASLGDAWCVYTSPGEGMLVLTGVTGTVRVKDHDRFARALQKLAAAHRPPAAGDKPPAGDWAIRKTSFAHHDVYYLVSWSEQSAFTLTWCLTDKELVISSSPQNVKAYLLRAAGEKTLADVPAVKEALDPRRGPTVLCYEDAAELFRLTYPLLQFVANAVVAHDTCHLDGPDPMLLPAAPTIAKYLKPAVSTLQTTPKGVELTMRQSLPCGNLGATLWVVGCSTLPTQADDATRNLISSVWMAGSAIKALPELGSVLDLLRSNGPAAQPSKPSPSETGTSTDNTTPPISYPYYTNRGPRDFFERLSPEIGRSTGNQTLPSPYYMDDDVQYFPPGPQVSLAREAAALKAFNTPKPASGSSHGMPGRQVVVQLCDGSRLTGVIQEPTVWKLNVAGSDGAVVPCDKISKITRGEDRYEPNMLTFHMTNGDKVRGLFGMDTIRLKADWGDVTIKTEEICSLEPKTPPEDTKTAPTATSPPPATPTTPGPARASNIWFRAPEGMEVHWDATGTGQFDSETLIAPARYSFPRGAAYRLKLSNIAGRPGVEFYSTLDVAAAGPKTEAYLAHGAVPVEFTNEDFDQALKGKLVTKAIIFPDPEYQELALPGIETLVSTRLEPGKDLIAEATHRGTILAIVCLGAKDLQRRTSGVNGETARGDGDNPSEPHSPLGYPVTCPAGTRAPGGGPDACPPAPITGNVRDVQVPQGTMPACGTPIGLPGPPHVPLGPPAGLQSHPIMNHAKARMPGPLHKGAIDAEQKPGRGDTAPADDFPEAPANDTQSFPRVPVLGPISSDKPEAELGPPSEAEVLPALNKAQPIQGGLPWFQETKRTHVRIVTEPISDYVDPPRVFPLIGPAQIHHVKFKCIVYFTEVRGMRWPLSPTATEEECIEVLYIDHTHLHLVDSPDAKRKSGSPPSLSPPLTTTGCDGLTRPASHCGWPP